MSQKSILVVEDNFLNMKLVRSILKLNRFNVLEAQDAETGIEKIREFNPDLVLMDIQLPGMDGLTATRKIKSDPELRDIPIVALTSYAMEGDENKAIEAGCIGYITKPISHHDFVSKVNRLVHGDETDTAGESVPYNRPRILIVDDDPMNRKVLKAKLKKDQYELHTASSGQECLDTITTCQPDLILLDIMMPGMDGYEVTSRLKSDRETKNIPIILVTALDDSKDKIRGMEAGADEFLTKPVNSVELRARVSSMVRLKKYHEQLSTRYQSAENLVNHANSKQSFACRTNLGRVLLVEDNRKDIRLVENYLQDQPFELITASDGEKALEIIDSESVDVVLLDVVLPGINGYEVCRRLKKRVSTRNIQIVMITCLSDLESKIKGVEGGADDFLVKPINRKEIQARIKALLKKKTYLDQIRAHYEMALNSAITDGLTGLYNHSYFARFLELEMKRAQRKSYLMALVMADIDDFKIYNDNLGHLTGDMLLREIAQIFRANVREIDFVARYGGEEFAIILPYVGHTEALQITERVLNSVQSHEFANDAVQKLKTVTISAGIALCPIDATTVLGLIEKADEMLYKSKSAGKNCVHIWERPPNVKNIYEA